MLPTQAVTSCQTSMPTAVYMVSNNLEILHGCSQDQCPVVLRHAVICG